MRVYAGTLYASPSSDDVVTGSERARPCLNAVSVIEVTGFVLEGTSGYLPTCAESEWANIWSDDLSLGKSDACATCESALAESEKIMSNAPPYLLG